MINRSSFVKGSLIALPLLLWFCVEAVWALPRFSMRVGVQCITCHVNPSGGGMRTEAGTLYSRMSVPYKPSLRISGEKFTTKINEFFRLGTDLRVMAFDDDRGTTSIFPMQADFYFSAQLTEKITLYYDQGFRRGLDLNNFETFALAQVLPFDGYVKVGKFVPAFGWKLDNHTAFIRGGNASTSGAGSRAPDFADNTDGTGFSQLDKDVGAEVGFYPGRASIQLGVFNGGRDSTSDFDNNTGKAFVSRADYVFDFEVARATIGGSFYQSDESPSSLETIYGTHFGANWWKLTYTGEVDWEQGNKEFVVREVNPGVIETVTGVKRRMAQYHEVDYLAVRGVDLKFVYEFIDDDREVKGDSLHRLSGGIEFFPVPHQEIRLEYRHTLGNRDVNPDADLNEIIMMYHVFF